MDQTIDNLKNVIHTFCKLKEELDNLLILKKPNTIIHYNKGELGEICVIQKLYQLSNKIYVNLFGDDAIDGIKLLDITTKQPITNINLIKKAPSSSKADCLLQLNKTKEYLYISIKCQHGSPPTILNHTPRCAKVFNILNGDLKNEVKTLDTIIQQLNEERKKGTVGEDIQIKNILLSEYQKECIINTVVYFMFDGSGNSKSNNPCNALLEIKEINNLESWKFIKCNTDTDKKMYVQSIYERLILSMRDKGMPKSISNMSKKNITDTSNLPEIYTTCEPWIFHQAKNNKKKGSLHIRIKK